MRNNLCTLPLLLSLCWSLMIIMHISLLYLLTPSSLLLKGLVHNIMPVLLLHQFKHLFPPTFLSVSWNCRKIYSHIKNTRLATHNGIIHFLITCTHISPNFGYIHFMFIQSSFLEHMWIICLLTLSNHI